MKKLTPEQIETLRAYMTAKASAAEAVPGAFVMDLLEHIAACKQEVDDCNAVMLKFLNMRLDLEAATKVIAEQSREIDVLKNNLAEANSKLGKVMDESYMPKDDKTRPTALERAILSKKWDGELISTDMALCYKEMATAFAERLDGLAKKDVSAVLAEEILKCGVPASTVMRVRHEALEEAACQFDRRVEDYRQAIIALGKVTANTTASASKELYLDNLERFRWAAIELRKLNYA